MIRTIAIAALLMLVSKAVEPHSGDLCYEEATTTCGAGHLPRITHRDWSEAEIAQFRERSKQGTIAVTVSQKGPPRLLPNCQLPGKYTELKTQAANGRLWITNRALLVLDEVTGTGCAEATHQVAAFAVGRAPTGSAKNGSGTAATRSQFSALLVPTPCPSIADQSPARGCLMDGATGPQRQARAHELILKLGRDLSKADPADVLGIYAIAPDDPDAREYVAGISTECSMSEQRRWVFGQYENYPDGRGGTLFRPINPGDRRRNSMPILFDEAASDQNCLYQPPFRKCFPDIAPASPGYNGCWDHAESTIPPRPPWKPASAVAPPKPAGTAAAPAAGCAPAPTPAKPQKAGMP